MMCHANENDRHQSIDEKSLEWEKQQLFLWWGSCRKDTALFKRSYAILQSCIETSNKAGIKQ